MLITYLQQGTTVSIGLNEEPVVVGNGIAVFRINNKSPHQFYSKGVPFEPVFNGCTPAFDRFTVSPLHLIGISHSGMAWDVVIDQNKPDANNAWKDDGIQRLRLRHKLTEDLLLGRPFAEVIAEFEQEQGEKAMTALKDQVKQLQQEATFAEDARRILTDVFKVNEQAGKGSRVEVRKAILKLMPELVVELAVS